MTIAKKSVVWGLFAAGGTVAAFVFPVLIALFLLRVPLWIGALLLALMAVEVGPGDEVVLPSFTFFATAGAVWNAGFRPVFCDVDPLTFNVTAETVEEVWSSRTRAVVPLDDIGPSCSCRVGYTAGWSR